MDDEFHVRMRLASGLPLYRFYITGGIGLGIGVPPLSRCYYTLTDCMNDINIRVSHYSIGYYNFTVHLVSCRAGHASTTERFTFQSHGTVTAL